MVSGLLAAVSALVAQPAADLSWLAGYWLSCDGGREVSETWSDPRAGVMIGSAVTVSDGLSSWEFMTIGPSESGVSFFASPKGQAPSEFPAIELSNERAVFENPSHDFPQRVIYTRTGEILSGRIEGEIDGEAQSADWTYRKAKFNGRCPAPPR